MKSYHEFFLVMGLASSVTGCGLIFTGTTDPVRFSSEPSGAEVKVNGMKVGRTPLEFDVSKSGSQMIQFSKEGYDNQVIATRTTFNPVSILNTICLVCWLVDAVSAGMEEVDPDFYHVDLEPKLAK